MYCQEVLHSYLSARLNRTSSFEKLIKIADSKNIDYHNFKNSKLPRVEKVIGMLKGIKPPSILDIGFGRGKFLYPFLEEFGNYNITAIEKSISSIQEALYLNKEGYPNLTLSFSDLFDNEWKNKTFHTITALEVMEHIENTEKFLDECIRLAYKWLILSVTSKEDNNPEHIHLFTEEKINHLFKKYNLTPKYEYVLNNMLIRVKL